MVGARKGSGVRTAVEAYRRDAKQCDCPTHIGITEAGQPPYAIVKSAAGIAPLLVDGIGDTIRVSLLADKAVEIQAGFDILQATGRPVRKPELIACPTCGRSDTDLTKIFNDLTPPIPSRPPPTQL